MRSVAEKVMSYGVGAIDTTLPTEENKDFSFRIEYRVQDSMGNMANAAFRLIKVVCQPQESYCVRGKQFSVAFTQDTHSPKPRDCMI